MTDFGVETGLPFGTKEQLDAYRGLWHHGEVEVESLARDLGRAADQVRGDVDALCGAGLARWLEPGRRCRAVIPDLALSPLVTSLQSDLHRRASQLDATQQRVSELIREYHADSERSTRREVELIPAEQGALVRAADLVAESRGELLISVGAWLTCEEASSHDLWRLAAAKSAQRVEVRVLVHEAAAGSGHIRTLAEARGVRVRVVPVVLQAMVVRDGCAALVGAQADDAGADAVVVEGPPLVPMFRNLFEYYWRGASTLESETSGADTDLSRLEHTLLVLLEQGCTDETVARRVGMSVRTVRRVIAELAERAQASSRFQLGSRARSLGWFR